MNRPVLNSLHAKLALAFAAALLPVLIVMLWGFRADVRESQENVMDFQLLAAEAVAVQVEETFEAAFGMAWAVANDPSVQSLESERLDAHLKRLLGRHPVFEVIGVYDAKGLNRGWGGHGTPPDARQDISDRNYFRTVMGTNGPALSEVTDLKRDGGGEGIVVAVPLRDAADHTTGVVTVVMSTVQLSKWYEETRLRPGQSIFLIDRRGQLVFHSAVRHISSEQASEYMNMDAVRGALSGTPQTVVNFTSPILKDSRIGAFAPTRRYHWVVGVTSPQRVALEPVYSGLRRQLAGVLGTLLLSGLVATLVARKLTAPLSRLRAHALAIGQGKLFHRVEIETGDEFQELGNAFNEMAHQIQTRDAHLRANEERFRATFEQAAVGIAHNALDGTWLWVNDRLCEIVGYSREELVERTFQDITHPDDRSRDVALSHELLDGRFQKYVVEKRYIRKDGRAIWVNVTVSLVCDSDGEAAYFIVVVEDIQRRKEMEEDRQQILQREQAARARAEAAIRAKDQLLATVSHELRTPLTPVLAALDLLDEEALFSRGARSCLKMIRGNIEMEARLVGDLLDITRIQQAKLELHRAAVDVHELMRVVLSYFEHEINMKRLGLKVELSAEHPIILADRGRLQQVFWNLLSNAVKYTPEGGQITVESRNEPGLVKISVADTGIGITPELMSRMFKAFQQGEQTLTRRYGGLGLGLTISKALVEMHEGQLNVASDGAGKGATFIVNIPLPTPHVPGAEIAPPVTSVYCRPCRILLVEDNPDTQRILAKLLQRSGHTVETASNVREALEMAEREEHDLLVTDIGLPDASGWELLKELNKKHPIRAIAISGFGTPEDQEKSRNAGFLCHLVKPLDYRRLREAISEAAAQEVG